MMLSPSQTRLHGSFLACVSYILELAPADLPQPAADEDPALGWTVSRWLGGLGMGIAGLADPASFAWPGPWIARLQDPDSSPAMP